MNWRLKLLLRTLPAKTRVELNLDKKMYHMVPFLLPDQSKEHAAYKAAVEERKLPHRIRTLGLLLKGKKKEVQIIELPMVAVDKTVVYELAQKVGYK